MAKEPRQNSDVAPVVVNVNRSRDTHDLPREGKHKNGNGITIAAVAGLVGMLIGAITFFSTYIFVTKAELAAHKTQTAEGEHKLEKQQVLTDASLKQVADDLKDMKIDQKVINANVNKLLRRSSIQPASRSDIALGEEDQAEGDTQ